MNRRQSTSAGPAGIAFAATAALLTMTIAAAAFADASFSCGKWRRLSPGKRAEATEGVVEMTVANFAERLEGRADAKEHIVAFRSCLQSSIPQLVEAIDGECANRRSKSAADLGAALGPAIAPCLEKWQRAASPPPAS